MRLSEPREARSWRLRIGTSPRRIWETALRREWDLKAIAYAGKEEMWRKRVRVEHTLDTAKVPSAGFEDREDHRIPFASVLKESKRNPVLFQMRPIRPLPCSDRGAESAHIARNLSWFSRSTQLI